MALDFREKNLLRFFKGNIFLYIFPMTFVFTMCHLPPDQKAGAWSLGRPWQQIAPSANMSLGLVV